MAKYQHLVGAEFLGVRDVLIWPIPSMTDESEFRVGFVASFQNGKHNGIIVPHQTFLDSELFLSVDDNVAAWKYIEENKVALLAYIKKIEFFVSIIVVRMSSDKMFSDYVIDASATPKNVVYVNIPELSIRAKFVNGELAGFEPMYIKDGKWMSDAERLKSIEFICANCAALNWYVRNLILFRKQDILNYRSK